MEEIAGNLRRLWERIERARARAGLPPGGVGLVAVSKGVAPDRIRAAVLAGITDVGENRVQEARAKHALVPGVRWHMVGHLQSNKARAALELFDLIHSVDRPSLLEALRKPAEHRGVRARVLVQVNTSGEQTKSGVAPEAAFDFVRRAGRTPGIEVLGLMTIGPLHGGPEAARPGFAYLRGLAERLEQAALPGVSMRYLSMGMSGDFEVAVEEGANLLRIGTAIFGPRKT